MWQGPGGDHRTLSVGQDMPINCDGNRHAASALGQAKVQIAVGAKADCHPLGRQIHFIGAGKYPLVAPAAKSGISALESPERTTYA